VLFWRLLYRPQQNTAPTFHGEEPSRSNASLPAPAHPRCCGCGGLAPARSTLTWPGAPTLAGSTWSTPSGSASKPSAGPRHGRAIPSRPTAGPGWCWPPTASCGWPARPPAISGYRGSGPDPSRDCHRSGCTAGFRGCLRARLAGHHAETRGALPRTAQGPCLRACRALPGDQEAHQEAPQQADQGHEDRLTDHSRHYPAAGEVRAQLGTPAGLNHKLTGCLLASALELIVIQ
jgi:hypothetical protein